MSGKYGGENNQFPSPVDPGKKLYVEVDAVTGEATYYEDKGILRSIKLGSIKPGEEFVPNDPLLDAGFFEVFNEQQRKEFLSDANQKKLRQKALEAAVRGNEAAGENPAAALDRANKLLDPDYEDSLPAPGRTEDEVAEQQATTALSTLNEDAQAIIDSVKKRSGTRKGAGAFGDFSYPKDRSTIQDFMKFTLLEYKPKKLNSGDRFGFGDRANSLRKGPNGETGDRVRLGSVSLPIPGGIRDQNGADWAADSMNEVQIQAAGLARAMTGVSGESTGDAAGNIVNRLGTNSEVVKKAIGETFAGKAVGVQRLMTRATGMTFNPNLELLFDKPVLRGFQFSFDLVPRSKLEAEEVVKIIKFFKQGMSPIRSEANLFLLSPNVFQVQYVLGGDGSKDHPFIGKMKECAMTNFEVDYTPQQNYSTLTDGFMTAYKISMQLKELEPVFNDDYGTGDEIEIGF